MQVHSGDISEMIGDISEDEHLSSQSLHSSAEQGDLVEIDAQNDSRYYNDVEQKIRAISYAANSLKDMMHQEEKDVM